MKFHKQLCEHNPNNHQYGDCFRTVLACLLDLEPEQVPHFVELYPSDSQKESPEMRAHILKFLKEHDCSLFDIPCQHYGPPEEIMKFIEALNGENMCYILSGMSRNTAHSVICKGSSVFWDPSPASIGLTGPIEGVYWISLLISSKMRYENEY